MKHPRPALYCACLLAVLAFLPGTAAAQYPSYVLLYAPAAPDLPHHPTYGYYPGTGYGVSTNAYSYGFFGVRPRHHHKTIHFGYYRDYTQWSFR